MNELNELLRVVKTSFFNSWKFVLGVPIVIVTAWMLYGGFYSVEPGHKGIPMVFGKPNNVLAEPGLNWNWPSPIGNVKLVNTTLAREISIAGEMLTGDENIVVIGFNVIWQISDPLNFVFKVQNTESTVRAVAESEMRTVIGQSNLDAIMTENREPIQIAVSELIQKTLDEYEAGVSINEVPIQQADPPQSVISVYRDVQAARADQERVQNEAQAYSNKHVPAARSEADRLIQNSEAKAFELRQEAEAYKESVVKIAEGQASRFKSVLAEYEKAPDIIRRRMYLDAIAEVYEGTDKIIMGDISDSGVLPYLPLNEIKKPSTK